MDITIKNLPQTVYRVIKREAEEQGRLRPGDTVLMVGFGAGLTWGAGVIQWAAHLQPEREAVLAGASRA